MTDEDAILHEPVMLAEVLDYLQAPRADAVVVDCTIGYGGHAEALTSNLDEGGRLIGIDRDENALNRSRSRFDKASFIVSLYLCGFSDVERALNEEGVQSVDRILIDCGFSSPQIDQAERGFSFQKEGPLDMRMDRRQVINARDIVANWSDLELADIFKRYGDERFARKIAKAIVRRRQIEEIATTQELADVILQAIPASYRYQEGIHPATRVFQALRIEVNRELDELREGLDGALNRLAPGGCLGVLSYHSLEHRIVKEKFNAYCGRVGITPGPAQLAKETQARGRLLTRKGLTPCAAERERNPRCRSAQFRVLERIN